MIYRHTLTLLVISLVAAGSVKAQVVAGRDRFSDVMEILLPATAAGISLYRHDTDGLKQFGYAAALTAGTSVVLKNTVHSVRPDGSGKGFPSGHAAMTFASASYVHFRYGVETALPLYALAGLTASRRVSTHNHFTKDVLAGAAIGSGSAWLFTSQLRVNSAAMMVPTRGGAWVNFTSQW